MDTLDREVYQVCLSQALFQSSTDTKGRAKVLGGRARTAQTFPEHLASTPLALQNLLVRDGSVNERGSCDIVF